MAVGQERLRPLRYFASTRCLVAAKERKQHPAGLDIVNNDVLDGYSAPVLPAYAAVDEKCEPELRWVDARDT